jgi:hypothetical protein
MFAHFVSFNHAIISRNSVCFVYLNSNYLVNSWAVFRYGTTFSGVAAPFQVTLTPAANTPAFPIQLDSLRIHFSNPRHGHCFIHTDNPEASKLQPKIPLADGTFIQWIDCTDAKKTIPSEPTDGTEVLWTKEVDLTITRGTAKVFEGLYMPTQQDELSVSISIIRENAY